MIHSIRNLLLIAALLIAPSAVLPTSNDDVAASEQQASVSVPIYPNASCPIMGKPVSTRLFAETDKGRIYVCCKSCIQDIRDDVETAYRTAFPAAKKLTNAKCPVTGSEIQKDSPTVALQGFEFSVRDADAARVAREDSQVVVAKLNDPKLVDLANKVCPVSGEPTAKNAFVVIDGNIVRLSSPKLVEEVSKDPAKILAKVKEQQAKGQDASSADASIEVDASDVSAQRSTRRIQRLAS